MFIFWNTALTHLIQRISPRFEQLLGEYLRTAPIKRGLFGRRKSK